MLDPNFNSYEIMLFIKNEVEKITSALKTIEVGNFPESVNVENLDELKIYFRDEFGRLLKGLKDIIPPQQKASDSPNMTQEIRLPESIAIKGLGEFEASVKKLLSVLETKDFSPKVTYNAPDVIVPEIKIPDIKMPDIVIPEPKVTIQESDKEIDFSEVIDALKPLQFLSNRAGKPITVRMSDGQNFIKALQDVAQKTVTAYSASSGMTIDEFKTVSGTPKTFASKKVTVTTGGTAVNVSTTSVACCEVYLSADTDAGKVLVVGGSDVDASTNNKNGIILIPGNDPFLVRTNDLKNLWVDSDGNGGILCLSYSAL